nr:hypothetical protein [Tanacetum cinerariifolium]
MKKKGNVLTGDEEHSNVMGNSRDERFAGTVLTDITAIHNPIASPTLKLSEVGTSSSTVGLDVAKNKDRAWTKYVSGGVTLLRISSTKHKERPLRGFYVNFEEYSHGLMMKVGLGRMK